MRLAILLTLLIRTVISFNIPSYHGHVAEVSRRLKSKTNRYHVNMSERNEAFEENSEISSKQLAKKIAGRKKRVSIGYQIIMASYSIFFILLVSPSCTPFYGVGPLLMIGIAYILKEAANNDRLSSVTYKRLNIAMFSFACVEMLSAGNMKWIRDIPIFLLLSFITTVNSVKGYGYGLKGWELGPACVKEDLVNGVKYNINCMTKIPNIKSFGYWTATLTMSTLTMAKFIEAVKFAMGEGGCAFLLGTRLFRAAKSMLLSVIAFTLKDAADRDRLEGTTFIELNFLLATGLALWGCKLFYLCS